MVGQEGNITVGGIVRDMLALLMACMITLGVGALGIYAAKSGEAAARVSQVTVKAPPQAQLVLSSMPVVLPVSRGEEGFDPPRIWHL